jgi:hypothetical protein
MGSILNPPAKQTTVLTGPASIVTTLLGPFVIATTLMVGQGPSGAAASVAGSAGQVQVNIGGTFAGTPSITVDPVTGRASLNSDRVLFGGATAAFPALKRNGAGLDVRLADDSGYAALAASTGYFGTSVSNDGYYLLTKQTTALGSAAQSYIGVLANNIFLNTPTWQIGYLASSNNGILSWQTGSVQVIPSTLGAFMVGTSVINANGTMQINGDLGLGGGARQIRPSGNGDTDTLKILATQLIVGSGNSTAYGFTGSTLIAGIHAGDSVNLAEFGRPSNTAGRFQIYTTTEFNVGARMTNGAGAKVWELDGANKSQYIYDSYTDGSNYSRATFRQNGGSFSIYTEQIGTGFSRTLQLGTVGAVDISIFTNNVNTWDFKAAGHLWVRGDNGLDLGAPTHQIRTGYFGTSVLTPIINPLANTGFGTAPFPWRSGLNDRAIDIGDASAVYSQTGRSTVLANNFYRATTANALTYKLTGAANGYWQNADGSHSWTYSVSGAAGTVATFTDQMVLSASGTLSVVGGITTPGVLVAALGTPVDGTRAFVTDSTVAFTSANVGATVAGGGANQCPIVRIAGVWKIAG